MSPFKIPSTREKMHNRRYTGQDFWTKLLQSRLAFGRNRVMFDNCSKMYYWSSKDIPNRLSYGVFPSDKRSCAATPGFQNSTALDLSRQTTGLPVLSGFPLYLFWDFSWLGRAHQVRQQTTGLPVLSSLQYLILTQALEANQFHWDPLFLESHCRLMLYRSWWRRRAWRSRMMTLISWRCHWGWRTRTGWRTRWQVWSHDRNEVVRVTLYLNPVLKWDVVFDRWSTRKKIRFQRKTFRAIMLLACSRELSWSRICPTPWHTLQPTHASALLQWRLWLS